MSGSAVVTFRSCLLCGLLSAAVFAATASGAPPVQLQSYSVSALSSLELENPGSGAVARAVVTLGQSQPLGTSESVEKGTRVELGFLYAQLQQVPEPSVALLHGAAALGVSFLLRRRVRARG